MVEPPDDDVMCLLLADSEVCCVVERTVSLSLGLAGAMTLMNYRVSHHLPLMSALVCMVKK